MTRRPRFARARKSPRACACFRMLNVYASPGTAKSVSSFAIIWKNTPVSGPPLENATIVVSRGLIAGVPLSRYWPDRGRDLLVTVTEVNPRSEIDRLAAELGGLA